MAEEDLQSQVILFAHSLEDMDLLNIAHLKLLSFSSWMKLKRSAQYTEMIGKLLTLQKRNTVLGLCLFPARTKKFLSM